VRQELVVIYRPSSYYYLYIPKKAGPTAFEFYLMCTGDKGWVRALEICGGEVVGHITSSFETEDDGINIIITPEERPSEKDGESD